MMTEGCWRGDKDCFGGIRMELNWERKEDRKKEKNGRLCACAEDEIESSLTSDNTPLLSAKEYIHS